jgi:hypothetical protein
MTVPHRKFVLYAATLIIVFIGAVSMNVQRLAGWRFLLVCTALGAVGAAGANFGIRAVRRKWAEFHASQRALLIGAVIGLWILIAYLAGANMFEQVFTICALLVLWGAYSLFSALLDRVWSRFNSRL